MYYNTYILFPIGNISETASVWFTLVLSIERYLTMSQLGSVYQKKLSARSPNLSPVNQEEETLYSLGNIDQETQKTFKDRNTREESDDNLREQQHNSMKTWCIRLSTHCQLYKPTCYSRKCTLCTCEPKKFQILQKLSYFKFCKSIKMCSLAKCIQFCTCRNCHSKYSIVLIAIFSILFNLPLFFVQKVNSGIVPTKHSTEQMNNSAETNEWMHTTSKHMSNLTTSDYQNNQSQTQVYIGLTEFGSSEFYKIFSWIRIMLVQVLPLLFLCLVNFCLFRFIHIANRRRQKYLLPKGLNKKSRRFELNKINLHCPKANGGSSARWQAAQRKLTILLIVIVGLFIAGQIPQGFAYITIFEAFTSHFGSVCKRWRCCQPYLIYRSISHMLGLFTYAINFFVYLTLNKHFKQQLKIWFLSIFPSRNQLQKKYASKQTKPSYYSYNQSKSDGSFASQHKCNNNTRPYYNNRHDNIWKKFINLRRRSSILYYDNKNKILSIENTDFPSEAVSAPVDLYSSSKLRRKVDFIQIDEMNSIEMPKGTVYNPYNLNTKVNSIQTPESLLSSNQPITTLADDTLKHLIINNPCYTNQQKQPPPQRQSTVSRGNDTNYQSFVSLQPTTKCHTEIKYGTNHPLLLYKTFRAYYSHDSVVKKWTFELNCMNNQQVVHDIHSNTTAPPSSSSSSSTSSSSSITQNYSITSNSNIRNLDNFQQEQTNQKQLKDTILNNTNNTHCVNLLMMQNSNNNSNNNNDHTTYDSNNIKENSKICRHSIVNSDSQGVGLSFSHIYCPLVYRESDFDVISVDDSVEQHETEHNSFL
ncbi:unnamed protein product [Trichobilharzia szidati]|nr:unnamed protein product [Trichobilharzia szidati]